MNPSRLYVPNPQKWVQFFDKVAKGKVKYGQSGDGNITQIIPMDQYTSYQSGAKQLPVNLVSPAGQTVNQAKSELERVDIKPFTVKELFQKSQRSWQTVVTQVEV